MSETRTNVLHTVCDEERGKKNESSSNNTEHVTVHVENEVDCGKESEKSTRCKEVAAHTLLIPNASAGLANIELQEGKRAHFFVSYSNEDKWRVIQIIKHLEKEYGVVCLFDENFTPGRSTHQNIVHAVENSMMVLCFLSKSFNESNFCKFEARHAIEMSVKTGDNNIIPVLLEECEIPSSMKTMTYIDATRYGAEFCSKIIEALRNRDKADNGYYIDLIVEHESCSLFITPSVEEPIDVNAKQLIQNAKFEVPTETFQRAINIVNSFRKKTRWGLYDGRMILCLWLYLNGFVWMSVTLVYALSGLVVFSRNISSASKSVEGIWSTVNHLACIIVTSIVTGLLLKFMLHHILPKWDIAKMKDRIFKEMTMETYKQGALFEVISQGKNWKHLITFTKYCITLRVTRYNIHPCLRFLAKRFKEGVENKLNKDMDSSERFDALADELLRKRLRELISRSPKDAPVTRHHVRGEKECFCQRIEALITDDVISDICEKHFSKEETEETFLI